MYMHMYMGIVKGILTLEINIKYSCLAVVHICERKKVQVVIVVINLTFGTSQLLFSDIYAPHDYS